MQAGSATRAATRQECTPASSQPHRKTQLTCGGNTREAATTQQTQLCTEQCTQTQTNGGARWDSAHQQSTKLAGQACQQSNSWLTAHRSCSHRHACTHTRVSTSNPCTRGLADAALHWWYTDLHQVTHERVFRRHRQRAGMWGERPAQRHGRNSRRGSPNNQASKQPMPLGREGAVCTNGRITRSKEVHACKMKKCATSACGERAACMHTHSCSTHSGTQLLLMHAACLPEH